MNKILVRFCGLNCMILFVIQPSVGIFTPFLCLENNDSTYYSKNVLSHKIGWF